MARVRLGIIDLGTNSVRFDIHEIKHGKVVQTLHRERFMVRLGQGVFINGEMDREAIARTVEAFVSFKYTADFLQVQKIIAVATSAVRHARDREKLVRVLEKRTGIVLRVISGQEEARLIARGILTREKKLPDRFVMADIGGGSVEVSLCKSRKSIWSQSFQLGTACIDQLFGLSQLHLNKKRRLERVQELKDYIASILDQYPFTKNAPKIKKLIGSSGTMRAMARLEGKGDPTHDTISYDFIKKLVKRMVGMDRPQLLAIPGMDASRVDMILGGAVLIQELMLRFEAEEIKLTNYALREGILDEEVRLLTEKKDSHLGLHLLDLEERLERSLTSVPYARRVSLISQELFQKLASLHKLKPEWKNFLVAAAYLQNTGTTISALHHAQHSFYITQHLDFPWLDEAERECLAHMCLWHSDGKVDQKDLGFLKSRSDRESFLKTLSLLRIANAIVWHNRSTIKVTRASYPRGAVKIKLMANGSRELVKLRLESRKKLFEKVFKKKLLIQT